MGPWVPPELLITRIRALVILKLLKFGTPGPLPNLSSQPLQPLKVVPSYCAVANCTSYYNTSLTGNTIVSAVSFYPPPSKPRPSMFQPPPFQFDLGCSEAMLGELPGSVFVLGLIVGVLPVSQMADRLVG